MILWAFLIDLFFAPDGWEDRDGFHLGVQEDHQ